MNPSSALLDHHLAQTTSFPFALEIERAEGAWLVARDGRRYLDLISGIGVSNLGHGHPAIREAIHRQADRHLHVMVYGEYIQEPQLQAAERLCAFLPAPLDTCYFVNSGTEANEAAIKLARRVTGRAGIVSFQGAYHGNTLGSMSVSWNEAKKAPFRPLLPEVDFIRLNEREDLLRIHSGTAAVILETVQGDAGIRIPDTDYLEALRARCDETGALLIFDEIQCGMGRTGRMWAFEHFGIRPDILTLGKALGGGMPVGCMVSSRERMELLTHHPPLGHISTFAGHPVVCAAVAACLDVYAAEHPIQGVQAKGEEVAAVLRGHSRVRAVRQIGYFFAVDLGSPDEVQQVVGHCLAHGVITFWFLSCPSSFRIAPPLTLSEEEWTVALDVILAGLDSLP